MIHHKSLRLAHRHHTKRLCLYTDHSETHWAKILEQVPAPDVSKRLKGKQHEPLVIPSGRLSGTQLRWSTIVKKLCTIMTSAECIHWILLATEGFDLSTDHNDLIFIFEPASYVPDLGQAATRKAICWAVHISSNNYECLHIAGLDSYRADLMTCRTHSPTVRWLISVPPLTSASDQCFAWLAAESLATIQQ